MHSAVPLLVAHPNSGHPWQTWVSRRSDPACAAHPDRAVWAQSLPPALANAFLPPPASENSQSNNEDDLKIVRLKK